MAVALRATEDRNSVTPYAQIVSSCPGGRPSGRRHHDHLSGVVPIRGVAILGRPEGRPPEFGRAERA